MGLHGQESQEHLPEKRARKSQKHPAFGEQRVGARPRRTQGGAPRRRTAEGTLQNRVHPEACSHQTHLRGLHPSSVWASPRQRPPANTRGPDLLGVVLDNGAAASGMEGSLLRLLVKRSVHTEPEPGRRSTSPKMARPWVAKLRFQRSPSAQAQVSLSQHCTPRCRAGRGSG